MTTASDPTLTHMNKRIIFVGTYEDLFDALAKLREQKQPAPLDPTTAEYLWKTQDADPIANLRADLKGE